MRIITTNVRKDLTPRSAVVKCASLINKKASIIGFQEIESPEHHADIRKGLSSYKFTHPGQATPFAIDPTVWSVVGTGRELVHNGMDHASPNRYNTWVVLQSLIRPKLPPIWCLNTHMVVKSQTSKLAAPKWRAQMWQIHLTSLQKRVHALSVGGMAGFILGDFNSGKVPIPGVKWLAGGAGIDHIGVHQSTGLTIIRKGTFKIPNPSDHDALGLVAQLKRN
jgi:hypothetical protein